jgi:hypothetical protein
MLTRPDDEVVMFRTLRSPTLLLAALLTALLAGCLGNHDPVGPRGPGATLATLWPNDDGRSWSYQVVDRQWPDGGWTTYPTLAAVPPAPSMSQVAALLDTLRAGTVGSADTAAFVLRFQGMITTQSGVTRQNLTETLITPSSPGLGLPAPTARAAFLARLYRARPDLRVALRARLPFLALPADTLHRYVANLLHGYAWEKTTRWIGTYGDVDTLLAWKFLTSNLIPGSEFTHQLVPALASDVFLHGRILSRRRVVTPAGVFENAVVCAYLIDYGTTALTDPSGNPTGYTRFFDYGSVSYADQTGPVACYERRMLAVGGVSIGDGDVTLRLTATGPGAFALGSR